jgi:glucose-6-phosphate dehydrogenase assembly protein OpcA
MADTNVLPASVPASAPADREPVPLDAVERELVRQVRALQAPGEAPMMRACMSNLVIFCDRPEQAAALEQAVPLVLAVHPARVLLLLGEAGVGGNDLTATVAVSAHQSGAARKLFSEQVTLHATGSAVNRLPFALRELMIGDLPTNLWWAVPQPPPLAGVLLHDLAEHAEQIIYDSIGWPDPVRGVLAVGNWLPQFERGANGCWRVASDLNWRRLKYWRRLLTQALDPASAPGALESVEEVLLEHGPHAVVQAWELASWLASRLGWRVRGGRVQAGVELLWNCDGPRDCVRLRIHRLEEGAPAIRSLRMTCMLNGKPTTLNFSQEDDRRLAVVPEGGGAEPRTLTIPPQPLADLLGRQLSDRERDAVFRQSMEVARALAQSVLE